MWWCGVIFFFKQKTSYDLRISDWSSDVCSSDLVWVSAHHLSTLRLATEPLSGRRLVYARCRPSSRRTVRLAWKSAFRSVSFAQLRVYRWRLHPDRFGLEDTLRRPARRRAGDDGHLWLDPSPAISRLHTRDVRVPAAMADAADAPHVSGVGRHVCASRPHRGTRCDRKLRHRL